MHAGVGVGVELGVGRCGDYPVVRRSQLLAPGKAYQAVPRSVWQLCVYVHSAHERHKFVPRWEAESSLSQAGV